MRLALILSLSVCLVQQASARMSLTEHYSQEMLLKNWALSRCLAKTYNDETVRDDANATASAYLEYGKQSIETYHQLDEFVDKYVNLAYGGSVKSDFNTMKCIDLYHSKELQKMVLTALKNKRN